MPSVSVLRVLGLDGVDQVQSIVNTVGSSSDCHLTTRAAFLRIRYLDVRSWHLSETHRPWWPRWAS